MFADPSRASPPHPQWPPFEQLSPSINFHVHWWTQANFGWNFKPHFIWWTQNLMCFDGNIFVFPLLKPHVFCQTQTPHVIYGPSPSWNLMFFDGPKSSWLLLDQLFFHPPKTSRLLLDPKTSGHLMDPQPHVFWWTGRVHQKTWVPKIALAKYLESFEKLQ